MHKTILMATVFVLSLSASAATEQGSSQITADSQASTSASKINIVPTVGLGSAAVKVSGAKNLKPTAAVSAAGLVEFGTRALTMQTGLGLTMLGTGISDDKSDPSRQLTDARMNLTYLNVPVIGKFNFSGSQSRAFFVKAGLMPGFLVHKEVTYKLNDEKKSTKDISGIKSFDLPVVVGLGGAFPLQNGYGLVFDLSWIRSLQTIAQEGNAYNESFMVSGGFNIPFQ